MANQGDGRGTKDAFDKALKKLNTCKQSIDLPMAPQGALVGNAPKLGKLQKRNYDGKHMRQKLTAENWSQKGVKQPQSATLHQKSRLEMGGKAITLRWTRSKEQCSSGTGCKHSWTCLN